MKKPLQHVMVAVGMLLVLGAQAEAQAVQPPAAPENLAAAVVRPLVPLKVQIVISRYEGEKKVSSLPYTLQVNANDGRTNANGQYTPYGTPARLRMGAQVAVPSLAIGGPSAYKDIGTNIDCWAQTLEDGRLKVSMTIEDTSVYGGGQGAQGIPKVNDVPTFRSFRLDNSVILKDGQTTQFTAAGDKVTGEIVKVDVTASVVK